MKYIMLVIGLNFCLSASIAVDLNLSGDNSAEVVSGVIFDYASNNSCLLGEPDCAEFKQVDKDDDEDLFGCVGKSTQSGVDNNHSNDLIKPEGLVGFQNFISGKAHDGFKLPYDCGLNEGLDSKYKIVRTTSKGFSVAAKNTIVLSYGNMLIVYNVIVDRLQQDGFLTMSQPLLISENIIKFDVTTSNLKKLEIDMNFKEGFNNHVISDLVYIAFSEDDPSTGNSAILGSGRCSALGKSPFLNISTLSMMVTDKNSVCNLESKKQYFLTRVYLDRL